MAIDNTVSELKVQMENEIQQYLTELVDIDENHQYSQAKLIRRISMFENKIYPTGKFDKQGNYKYWYDIIGKPIDNEVKNVDFDTRDIIITSERKNDVLACNIVSLAVKEYLRDTGQGEEINSAIEEGAGWGNILWKRIKKSYERCDLKNTYVINQTARTVDETPIIERHQMISSDMRAKMDVWENVKDALRDCKVKEYKTTIGTQEKESTVPNYSVFERNGEVSVWALKKTNGEEAEEGDREKYVLARVIGCGVAESNSGVSIKYIMYAQELKGKKMSDIYKEYHRGRYKGRWFREGLYELLFDLQVRANAVGNQLAQGLEWVSKQIFYSPDKLIVQSLITDLKNGDIIKATALNHVPVRIDGFEQLVNEWNRIIELRNEISNSMEVVSGEAVSNQPYKLGQLLDNNANKLYDFIREKLSIPFSEMFHEWLVPDLVKDLKAKDILRLSGDATMMERLCMTVVDNWYLMNLASFPPHTNEQAMFIKKAQYDMLKARPQILAKGIKQLFDGFVPNTVVVISGEQLRVNDELATMSSFVSLEMDPIRRTALIEEMMAKKGIDAKALPKSMPGQLGTIGGPQQAQREPVAK